MKAIFKISALILAMLGSSAQAENMYESIYNKCTKKAGAMNNSVVQMCSEEATQKAKSDINKFYKAAYEKISKSNVEDAKKLEEAQKSWVAYRNSHCNLAGSYVGSPMYAYCPMQLNSARALELKELSE